MPLGFAVAHRSRQTPGNDIVHPAGGDAGDAQTGDAQTGDGRIGSEAVRPIPGSTDAEFAVNDDPPRPWRNVSHDSRSTQRPRSTPESETSSDRN
ncbi:MAG: hypothetical protein ACQET5_09930 [Halobacteriota archaeon]